MNYLWGGMILIGIIYGAASGNWKEVTEAALDSSKEAVSLCVAMAGVTAMWAHEDCRKFWIDCRNGAAYESSSYVSFS